MIALGKDLETNKYVFQTINARKNITHSADDAKAKHVSQFLED